MDRVTKLNRCEWAASNPSLRKYHDEEWGVPIRDGRLLWEALVLDSFQSGLSWLTILNKRDAFRRAFADFHPEVVANFGETDVERLLSDVGIVRSRQKIVATIGNARAYLSMLEAGEEFSAFVWSFVKGKPILGDGTNMPVQTDVSTDLSKALKARGFKFVGPTTVYSWMQAVGMINDHATTCFRRKARHV
jgi:DNA-3-methyladenine glycosylase I